MATQPINLKYKYKYKYKYSNNSSSEESKHIQALVGVVIDVPEFSVYALSVYETDGALLKLPTMYSIQCHSHSHSQFKDIQGQDVKSKNKKFNVKRSA